MNTQPASEAPGIVPPGYVPQAPAPQPPSNPIAPVQVAAVVPVSSPELSVYSPAPYNNLLAPTTASAATILFVGVFPGAGSGRFGAGTVARTPSILSRGLYPAAGSGRFLAGTAAADASPVFLDYPPRHGGYPPAVPGAAIYGEGHTGWAIQVGAYTTSSNARAALGIAELSAVQMLVSGRPMGLFGL